MTIQAVELDQVAKRFGSTQALDGVSIAVRAGTVHALVGENGAGKSTLVKVMSGVVDPDEGRVRIAGTVVELTDPAAAAALGVHLVHQELALLPHRSIAENVFLGQELRGRFGLAHPAMRAATSDALGRLGLDLDPRRAVGELTTASRQMVEIARALVRDSRVVVLDEPTAALPPADAERLYRVIGELTDRGVAVVYVSHRLDEVIRLADEITVLKDGTLVATRPRGTVTVDELVGLMVGREVGDLYPPRGEGGAARGPVLLAVEDLRDPPAVRSATLSLHAGEVVGLYGLEGHGQDELLACLAGARRPVAGALWIDGEPAPWRDLRGNIDRGVGFVPEDRTTEGLMLALTGTGNVTLPILPQLAPWLVVPGGRERDVARDAAEAADVRGDVTGPVSSLSGGNQQKLVLARWIAARSKVLLLNQPTRGVDVGSKAEIYALIRRLCRDEAATALVVSREISELLGLCDRVLVMSSGRLAGEHPPTVDERTILSTAVGRAAA